MKQAKILNRRINPRLTLAWRYELNGYCNSVSLSADGPIVAVGTDRIRRGGDGDIDTIYLLDTGGRSLWSRNTGRNDVVATGTSGDGSLVVAGTNGSYGDAAVYGLTKHGELLWKFHTGASVEEVSVSFDGSAVVAGSEGGNLYILNRGGRLLGEYSAHDPVRCVSVSPDGSTVIGGAGGRVVIGTVKGYHVEFDQYKAGGCVKSVSTSMGGYTLLAGSDNGQVYVFDRQGNKTAYRTKADVTAVSACHDGSVAAVGTSDGQIYVVNKNGELLWRYQGEKGKTVLSISANGTVIIAGMSNAVHMFTKDGESLGVYETDSEIKSVSVSGDGSFLAVAVWKGNIYLFRHLTPEAEERTRTEELKAEIINTIDEALRDK